VVIGEGRGPLWEELAMSASGLLAAFVSGALTSELLDRGAPATLRVLIDPRLFGRKPLQELRRQLLRRRIGAWARQYALQRVHETHTGARVLEPVDHTIEHPRRVKGRLPGHGGQEPFLVPLTEEALHEMHERPRCPEVHARVIIEPRGSPRPPRCLSPRGPGVDQVLGAAVQRWSFRS